jgi:hypothetical protein
MNIQANSQAERRSRHLEGRAFGCAFCRYAIDFDTGEQRRLISIFVNGKSVVEPA